MKVSTRILTLASLACVNPAEAQSLLTVPSAAIHGDLVGAWRLAESATNYRVQIVIGSGEALQLANRLISGLRMRRDSTSEVLFANSIQLDVKVSSLGVSPDAVLPIFAQNHGGVPTTVFSGSVSLGHSPGVPPGQTASWVAPDSLVLPLATPFTHTGGTLVVDLVIRSSAGFQGDAWSIDAMLQPEPTGGVPVGAACGTTGLGIGDWSSMSDAVVPGATVQFSALGTAHGLGMVLFGVPAANVLDLRQVGGPSGCWIHLASILNSRVVMFGASVEPSVPSWGGSASVSIQLPQDLSLLGSTLATQWVDLTQNLATSSARAWTIQQSVRQHQVAVVYSEFGAGPTPSSGLVEYGVFPALGFDVQ